MIVSEAVSLHVSGRIVAVAVICAHVVKHLTVNAVHPHFMAEALEHHTAMLTMKEKRI